MTSVWVAVLLEQRRVFEKLPPIVSLGGILDPASVRVVALEEHVSKQRSDSDRSDKAVGDLQQLRSSSSTGNEIRETGGTAREGPAEPQLLRAAAASGCRGSDPQTDRLRMRNASTPATASSRPTAAKPNGRSEGTEGTNGPGSMTSFDT